MKACDLLQQLESISVGLSLYSESPESALFLKGGTAIISSSMLTVWSRTALTEMDAVIPALPFTALLSKLGDKEITLVLNTAGQPCMEVSTTRGKAVLNFLTDTQVPTDMEKPDNWITLCEDHISAIMACKDTSMKNSLAPSLSCVHLTEKYAEASDTFCVVRKEFNTALPEQCHGLLLSPLTCKFIQHLGVGTKMGVLQKCVMLQRGNTTVQIQRVCGEFPDLSEFISITGDEVTLPKSVFDAIDRARVFSTTADEMDEVVRVTLSDGAVRIQGDGGFGVYSETLRCPHKQKVSFSIHPKFLRDILERHRTFTLGKSAVKMSHDGYTYVASIGSV